MTINVDDFSPGGRPRQMMINLAAPTSALMIWRNRPEVAAELARRAQAKTAWHRAGDDDPETKFDPHERRDPHGRWTRTGTAGIKLAGRPDGAGTLDDPIAVGADLDRAVTLLAAGKHIRLDTPMQVGTLLDKLAAVVHDAERRGAKAPVYDLCNVSVPGTNLFCKQSKGVPRVKMPQLKGFPVEGSPAWQRAGGRGDVKVSIEDDFRQALLDMGISTQRVTVPASNLKASQAELSGIGVANMVAGIRSGAVPDRPIFVTRDGYVIDGHHRWAAKVAIDTADNKLGDVPINVEIINMDIGAALDFARAFAEQQGIRGKAHGTKYDAFAQLLTGAVDERTETAPMPAVWLDVKDFHPDEPRDMHGRWSRVAGSLSKIPLPLSPRQVQTREGAKDPVKANADVLADPTQSANLPLGVGAELEQHVKNIFGVTPDDMDRNLAAVFERADAAVRADGASWYGRTGVENARIAADTGYTHSQVTGATAAMSPQMEWGANIALSEYLAHAAREDWQLDPAAMRELTTQTKMKKLSDGTKLTHTLLEWAQIEVAKSGTAKKPAPPWPDVDGTKLSDHPPLVRAALIKALGQAGQHTVDGLPLAFDDDVTGRRSAVSFSSGLNGMSKALRIYDGEAPGDVLNGHKVRSFYNNMMLNESNLFPDVTIDTHALSAAVGRPIPASSKLITKGFQQPTYARLGLKGTYPVFADAYRRIAAEHNLSTHQAQAIIWLQWRKEHP